MGDISVNFSLWEFTCKCGCGMYSINLDLVILLQEMREDIGALAIASGCRCAKYNRTVDGKSNSAHLRGNAVDIACTSSRQRLAIIIAAVDLGFVRIGIHEQFIHLDIDQSLPQEVLFLY